MRESTLEVDTMTTIKELVEDDRIVIGDKTQTIAKVWRYDDGSITIELKGQDPGMWNYTPDEQGLTVERLEG